MEKVENQYSFPKFVIGRQTAFLCLDELGQSKITGPDSKRARAVFTFTLAPLSEENAD